MNANQDHSAGQQIKTRVSLHLLGSRQKFLSVHLQICYMWSQHCPIPQGNIYIMESNVYFIYIK